MSLRYYLVVLAYSLAAIGILLFFDPLRYKSKVNNQIKENIQKPFINSIYYYYIENDFFVGGPAVILDIPDTCQPVDGFIIYEACQQFTCTKQPYKQVFTFESDIPEWPFVKIFICNLYTNNSRARLFEDC